MTHDLDVTLPSGRHLRARAWGPSEAPAVLYFHGTPESRLTLDIFAALSTSTPVRLVAFDRPGYGGSSFEPFSLASVADDARVVMDTFGIHRFAVLSQSGGGPFALSCAAHLDDRVTGVGVASGPGSFAVVPGAREDLIDSDQRAMALIGIDDAEAARLFKEGFADMATLPQQDTPAITESLLALLPTDRSVLSRPEVCGGIADSMREALRQGVDGCAWDNVAWIGAWDLDLSTISQPTWLWYGENDPLGPPEHGEWLKEQIPHAELLVRAGEGHLGLFSHWDEVVTALTSTIR